MQIEVTYLDNLKVQANFDDFTVISDQPVRYKGDATAPGPFDYFLASSVMCAAYFVKVYCKARDINTNDIKVTQDNIVSPDNRYKQTFKISVELPSYISKKDQAGILASIDRCTVKKTIQEGVDFVIEAKEILGQQANSAFEDFANRTTETMIKGKDSSLEKTITKLSGILENLGIKIEISSWRNPVPNVWSVHIRDADCPMNYTNGKGSTKESALCSALGEYLERVSSNYFYSDYYLGKQISTSKYVHYPNEKWFPLTQKLEQTKGLMDSYLLETYGLNGELKLEDLIDTNSGNVDRGVCAIPFIRQSDNEEVYIPVNLISNLFVSNGMSAGNSKNEARVQCLSEIFERAIKNKIITEEITLPDVPPEVIKLYPKIAEGINSLEKKGYPIVIKDASFGGLYPVLNVTLLNPKTGGVFSSFGAHPNFEIALERCLTELLQGRSFEGLNEMPAPTFNKEAVTEPNNIVEHFIDSTGVLSWNFFNQESENEFNHWNFTGTTEEEFNYLMNIFKKINKEVYIADYEDLGFNACRILVPNYSEIYPKEDLIYDNNNLAIEFRNDILTIHQLDETELNDLFEKLLENDLDDYRPVRELIGIAFDENSTWGELTIGELKALIQLSLGNLEDAKTYVEQFAIFNDASENRNKLYRLLDILIEIELDQSKEIDQFKPTLIKMYGESFLENAVEIVKGEVKFPGLQKTNTNLEGLDRHIRLINSYHKLQEKRDEYYTN